MNTTSILNVAIAIALFFTASPSTVTTGLSEKEVKDLKSFVQAQGSESRLEFWMAHPPDSDTPNLAIMVVAPPGTHPGNEKIGILVEVIAANDSPGLKCLKKFERGSIGTIVFKKDGDARVCGATVKIVTFKP